MAIVRNGKPDGDSTKMALQLHDFFSGYRRERFCREYIKDGNATRAAREAGYSDHTARTQGSRLLTFVDIQTRLKTLDEEASEAARVSDDYVRARLRGIVEVAVGNEPVPNNHYDPNVAARALEQLGKTTGSFADRSQSIVDTRVVVIFRTADDAKGVNRRIIHVNGSQPQKRRAELDV